MCVDVRMFFRKLTSSQETNAKAKAIPPAQGARWFRVIIITLQSYSMNIYIYIHQGKFYPSPLPPFQEVCPPRDRAGITPFSAQDASRGPFATTFLHRLLLFLLSKPFRIGKLPIFHPPEPSKSSIVIEKQIIF